MSLGCKQGWLEKKRYLSVLIKIKNFKKKLRNKYEYELGIMTGMNEAIMNQNDQMRLRILEQNDKIREVITFLKIKKNYF